MVSVRHVSGLFVRALILLSTTRVLRAAYEDPKTGVQQKLKDLNPRYGDFFVQSAAHGNKHKVMAILHMMTGIEPKSFDDPEAFHSRLAEDAESGDPLKYSPTIVFTNTEGPLRPRPIIYAEAAAGNREDYLLLEYYTDVASGASGLIGRGMNFEKLKQGSFWAIRPGFEKISADDKPLLSSTEPKLDTKGYFLPL
jgi:hypothetical protein